MALDSASLELGRFDYPDGAVDGDIRSLVLEPGEPAAHVMVRLANDVQAMLIANAEPRAVRLAMIDDHDEIQEDKDAQVVTAEARSPAGLAVWVGRVAYDAAEARFAQLWRPASFHLNA